MRYGILGPLEVTDGAHAVRLSQGRQRVLLAILLLHADEALTPDELIDALWGERPPPTAAGSLHNLVSALRKALGDGRLVTEAGGYRLALGAGELDAERFDALVEEARSALIAGDPPHAASVLRDALGLWRGRALGDLVYEPALREEAARLEDRRLGAIELRLDADLALGRHAELVPELDRLVADHPLRERLREQQILALYRSGRQAEALQAYQAARRHLVDELGIEPGPGLRRLERAVLDQDPVLAAPDAPAPAAAAATPDAPVRAAAEPDAPRRSARARRPVALAAAGLVALAAVALAIVLASRDHGGGAGLAAQAGASLAKIDPADARVVTQVPVSGTPTSVAIGSGAVWAVNADDRTITRIDSGTARAHTFAIGATPTDVAAGDGRVWIGTGQPGDEGGTVTNRLVRLDTDRLAVGATTRLPVQRQQGVTGLPGQIAIQRGAVWVVNSDERVVRLDPRSGRVTAVVPALLARSIAADARSVWAIADDGSTVVQVDPATATVRRRVRLGATRLDAIAVGAGAIWAADAYDGALWRLDPAARVITRTVPVGAGADGVAVGAGGVWVINSLRGTLQHVDPRSNRVVDTVAVGNTPRDVDAGPDAVWVTLAGSGAPVPAASAAQAGSRSLPRPPCGRVFTGAGPPQYLIASDLPLQAGPEAGTVTVANAVAFVVRQHRFRAGRFRVGYQSCDDSTAESGQADPGKCAANAKAYAAEPSLLGVVGPYNSSCAAVEIPILNAAPGGPIAIVSPSNSMVGLTHADFGDPPGALRRLYPTGVRNYARVYPADDAEATADALLARDLGVHRLYVLDDGRDVGPELARHFRRAARALGLRIAGAERWDPGGHGFRALAARVRAARADGIFVGGLVGSNGGPLVRALRAELGTRAVLIGGNPFGPVDFLWDDSRGAARGMYLSVPGVPNDLLGPAGRRFLRDFGATQPGVPVGGFAVGAAAATEVLLDAIARSDGTRASVSRALLTTRLRDSAIGPLALDRNGDIAGPPVTIVRVRGRSGASSLQSYEGAAIDRVIRPPTAAVR